MKSIKTKKNKFYFRCKLDIPRGTEIIGKSFTFENKVIGEIIDVCDDEAIIEADNKYRSLIIPETQLSCTAFCYKEN